MQGCRNTAKMPGLAYVQCWKGKPNSAIEAIIRKELIAAQNAEDSAGEPSELDISLPRFWLETCGTHTAANCCAAIALDPAAWIAKFSTPGGALMRPPDQLALWINEPNVVATLADSLPGVDLNNVMANEYRQLYPIAVRNVFGFEAVHILSESWDGTVQHVKDGSSVMLGLSKDWKTGAPLGHFIGAYAFDETTNELLYADPADYRHPDGHFADARMGKVEYEATVTPSVVAFMGEL